MDQDTVKTVISSFLTLGIILVPGVGEAIAAVGGQAEVTAVILGTWGLVHGLVHYVHSKTK